MRFGRAIFLMLWLGGPVIWAAHFLVVYASESVLCTRATPGAHAALVATATIICLGLIAAVIIGSRKGEGLEFLRWSTAALGALSALAVAWSGVVALVVPSCLPVG